MTPLPRHMIDGGFEPSKHHVAQAARLCYGEINGLNCECRRKILRHTRLNPNQKPPAADSKIKIRVDSKRGLIVAGQAVEIGSA